MMNELKGIGSYYQLEDIFFTYFIMNDKLFIKNYVFYSFNRPFNKLNE